MFVRLLLSYRLQINFAIGLSYDFPWYFAPVISHLEVFISGRREYQII